MKKSIVLIMLVLTAFVLAGCSKELDTMDEFYVYEGKEVVAAMESFDMDNIDFSEAVSESGILPGRDISTKRGIAIGSTARDVARKYKNVAVMINDSEVYYYEDFGHFLEGKNPNDVTCVGLITGKIEGDTVVNVSSDEQMSTVEEAVYLVISIGGGKVYNINVISYSEAG